MRSCTFLLVVLAVFLLVASGSSPATFASGGGVTNAAGAVGGERGHAEWTWANGPNVGNQRGTYGTQGTAAAGNWPGGRQKSTVWTDAAGNVWVFGGQGYYSSTGGDVQLGNDLWKFSAGQWTWMGGSNGSGQLGAYGTLGKAAADNIPGSRQSAASWTDRSGNFWLFGGLGFNSTDRPGFLNDLWKYSAGQWAWMGGSNGAGEKGVYGSLGKAAASNVPGARFGGVYWTDAAGNFWLFGGEDNESAGDAEVVNDVWRYSAGEWTWMGGSNLVNQKGTYGTLGKAAAGNIPGARVSAVHWTDASGNLWLFGGVGYDSAGTAGELNDLWKFSGGQWTWMGGSNVINQKGIYGTQGTPAAGNIPGARQSAVCWKDAAGNFWLFGGAGFDSTGTPGSLGDLWKYSGGRWTWMGGPKAINQGGTYGTKGVAAAGNVPGARSDSLAWTDAAGNLWLFGGAGFTTGQDAGYLNDLWTYEP